MKKNLQTTFQKRQHMASTDFELFYYEAPHPLKINLHSHDHFEFYFFLEGNVQMLIGDQLHSVTLGDILLLPPGVPHRVIVGSASAPYRRFVLWLSRDCYHSLLQSSPDLVYVMQYVTETQQYMFHNDRISFNSVQSKIWRLLEELRAENYGRKTQIQICFHDLLLSINRLAYEQNSPARANRDHLLYRQLSDYIEEHPEEDLSLENLSRIFFVSKYHISHVFKDNIGISIHQYITKKRLNLCREAIVGGLSITEAYHSFGFGDYSSFYRAFKKEYGISPKDFQDMQMEL